MVRSRFQILKEATFGLGPAEIRCLLLVLLIRKPEFKIAELASISGYAEGTARMTYHRAIGNLRRAHENKIAKQENQVPEDDENDENDGDDEIAN
ncbi:uncharacterized protein N7483_005238 [Penicillium malachiteum]|uniref:uncharacterized protein n=1 Tax=Penicillium malachiteum TaxID=1324776 RepID=UPI0025470E6F|nr:uncharacterized protein N7483_005238 [Penicillium malachiteum]KAJ5730730.1 hypothetical protein N7483_005238 [Penicillium malachiteum]